jgi:hypothetical protein
MRSVSPVQFRRDFRKYHVFKVPQSNDTCRGSSATVMLLNMCIEVNSKANPQHVHARSRSASESFTNALQPKTLFAAAFHSVRSCTISRKPLRMASYSTSSHAIRCLNVSKNSDEGCRMHSLLGKLRLTGAVAQHAHDVAARARVRCWCNTYNATTSACGYVPPFTSLTLVLIQLQYRLQAK